MELNCKATQVVLIDLDARTSGQRHASEKAEAEMSRLLHDFLRWQLDTDTFPIIAGSVGPLGFRHGFSPENAEKVLAWLAERGVKPVTGVGE